MKSLLFLLSIGLFHLPAFCQIKTVLSNSGIGWGNNANWSPAGVPVDGDKVIIPAGKTISVKGAFYSGIETIKIQVAGTLDFDPSGKLNLGPLSYVQLENATSTITSNGSASELITINGEIKYQGSVDGTMVGPKYASNISMASPSGFTLGVLPVKLISFSAQALPDGVSLKWKTAEEIDTKKFGIERSLNGQTWNQIAFVLPSGSNSNYSFLDPSPAAGDNFYRLKIIDMDGRVDISAVQKIRHRNGPQITVGPNPFVDHTMVYLSKPYSNLRIQLVNENGQVVKDDITSGQSTSFRLQRAGLPTGKYFLKLYDRATLYQTSVLIQ